MPKENIFTCHGHKIFPAMNRCVHNKNFYSQGRTEVILNRTDFDSHFGVARQDRENLCWSLSPLYNTR